MKRIVFLLVLCLCLCACGEKQAKETTPPEVIGINDLLADLGNQAKAEMHIGKATTLFVKINTVYSDHCTVSHQFRSGTADVYMEQELLAQLTSGQFAAIDCIVDRVDVNADGASFRYIFKDGQMADMTLFDEYVAYMNFGASYLGNDHIYDKTDLLKEYAYFRGGTLIIPGDELESYLLGTWERRINQRFPTFKFNGIHTPELTFYADGTYDTQSMGNDTTESEFRTGQYDTEVGTWTIQNGYLKLTGCLSSYGGPVYRISDNVFLMDGDIYIRCE